MLVERISAELASGEESAAAGRPRNGALLTPDKSALPGLLPAWRALEDEALEPCVATQSAWLAPMIAHGPAKARKPLVIGIDTGLKNMLSAMLVLDRERWRWGLPIPSLHSWRYPFAFSRLPLLHRCDGVAALRLFLTGMRTKLGAWSVIFQDIPAQSGFLDALEKAAAQSGVQVYPIIEHARCGVIADPADATADTVARFEQSLSRTRLRTLKRQKKALSKLGGLEMVYRQDNEPAEKWIDDFLQLELAGWKGREGTAIASDPAEARAVKQAVAELAAAGQVTFAKMMLNGEAIAILFTFRSGDWIWGAKTTYAENYARYSPGMLALVETTRHLLEQGGIRHIDSSTATGHPLFSHIWKNPLPHVDVMVVSPDLPVWVHHVLVRLEVTRRRLRDRLKEVKNRWLHRRAKANSPAHPNQ